MNPGTHWVERVVPPIFIGVVLWEFIRLRIRRQNEPQGALRGFYLETTYFGNRTFYEIPFYIKNYGICYGSNVEKFPLTKLPTLAFRHILSIMSPKEQVQLAITSKKTEAMIQNEKMKIKICCVYIQEEFSNIMLGSRALTVFCGSESYEEDKISWPHIVRKDVLPWRDQNLSPLQNTLRILRRCQLLYPKMQVYDVGFQAGLVKSIGVEEILNIPEFQNWGRFTVFGDEVEAKDLDLIMDKANETREIKLYMGAPETYNHENAFKFQNITYEDARWVKINHLLTLRNSNIVFIGKEKLTSKLSYDEINLLIKFWVMSDDNMFRQLFIYVKHPTIHEFQDLFRDLSVVTAFRSKFRYYLIASHSSDKIPLLSVRFFKECIRLQTLVPDEIEPDYKTPWTREYKILKIFTEKKVFEAQLADLERRQDGADAPKIEELKQNIEKLEEELMTHPIYYLNGKVVVEEVVEGE